MACAKLALLVMMLLGLSSHPLLDVPATRYKKLDSEIFKKIQLKGNVDEEEMKRVFNLGIGYCVVVPANRAELTMDIIRDEGIECWEIGEVYEGN